ncbi:hypothetical protein [Serratia sp. X10]|uniref:hypothetical protein n=1 Tax=Serratia TaxID=613 RepID=UPI0015F50F6C|nr:hypothetical protein [Serratia sp. X10]MCH6191220.1 hypothetical protein [Serratia sp. X10]
MNRKVFLFWGGMDLFFTIHFLWLNLSHRQIPFYTDFVVLDEMEQPLWFSGFWWMLSTVLVISIAISARLFLSENCFARRWAYMQTPLRIILAEPSLSFLPWLLSVTESRNLVLNFSLLIGSEALKVYSLHRSREAGAF